MARTHAPPSQAPPCLRRNDSAGIGCKLFDNCYGYYLLILHLQTSHVCLTSRLQMVDDMMVIAAPLHPSSPSIDRLNKFLLHLLHGHHEFLQWILSDFGTILLGVSKLSWIHQLCWFSLYLLMEYLIAIMLIKALQMIIFHNSVSFIMRQLFLCLKSN